MVGRLAARSGTGPVAVRALPSAALAVAAVFSPLIRELKEIRYQFDRPFVMDSGAYEAEFTVRATPVDEQIAATVDWWRERAACELAVTTEVGPGGRATLPGPASRPSRARVRPTAPTSQT
ncbi:hypothetical protein FHS36_002802 [Streptomyces eurocidicus]|uniref:Uncharacterized protein n=1 Tax=Streptomyces eurocidicus TaxID=66423 RepID=A0A7W8BDE3_STREU|nr:hypothetical protein [Streptomyces eurocidicus]